MSTPTVAELDAATDATEAAIETRTPTWSTSTSPPRPRRPSTRRSSPARATASPNPNWRSNYDRHLNDADPSARGPDPRPLRAELPYDLGDQRQAGRRPSLRQTRRRPSRSRRPTDYDRPRMPSGRNRSSTPKPRPNAEAEWADEWDSADSHAYMDRVEAGLEPEAEL